MTYRDLVAALSSGRRAIHRLLYPGLDLGRGDHLPLRWWARALWQAVSAPTSPGRARDRQGALPRTSEQPHPRQAWRAGLSARSSADSDGRAWRGAPRRFAGTMHRTREHYGSRRSRERRVEAARPPRGGVRDRPGQVAGPLPGRMPTATRLCRSTRPRAAICSCFCHAGCPTDRRRRAGRPDDGGPVRRARERQRPAARSRRPTTTSTRAASCCSRSCASSRRSSGSAARTAGRLGLEARGHPPGPLPAARRCSRPSRPARRSTSSRARRTSTRSSAPASSRPATRWAPASGGPSTPRRSRRRRRGRRGHGRARPTARRAGRRIAPAGTPPSVGSSRPPTGKDAADHLARRQDDRRVRRTVRARQHEPTGRDSRAA